jgi:hypothetical protein
MVFKKSSLLLILSVEFFDFLTDEDFVPIDRYDTEAF